MRTVYTAGVAVMLLVVASGCPGRDTAETGAIAIAQPANGSHLHGTLTVQVTSTGVIPDTVNLWAAPKPDAGQEPKYVTVADAGALPFSLEWNTDLVGEGDYQLAVQGVKGSENWVSPSVVVTVDRTAPSVVARQPAPGATNVSLYDPIQLTFSEPIDSRSLSANGFSVRSAGGATWTPDLQLSDAGTVLTLAVDAQMVLPAQLSAVIPPGLSDLAGNPLVVPQDSWAWSVPRWQVLPSPDLGKAYSVTPDDSTGYFAAPVADGGVEVQHLVGDLWPVTGDPSSFANTGQPELEPATGAGKVWLRADSQGESIWEWTNDWHELRGVPFDITFSRPQLGGTESGRLVVAGIVNNGTSYFYANSGTLVVATWDGTNWATLPAPFSATAVGPPNLTIMADGDYLVSAHAYPVTGSDLGPLLFWHYSDASWTSVDSLPADITQPRILSGGHVAYAVWTSGYTDANNLTDGQVHVSRLDGTSWTSLDVPTLQSFTIEGLAFASVSPAGEITIGISPKASGGGAPTAIALRYSQSTWENILAPTGSQIYQVFPDSQGHVCLVGSGTPQSLFRLNE